MSHIKVEWIHFAFLLNNRGNETNEGQNSEDNSQRFNINSPSSSTDEVRLPQNLAGGRVYCATQFFVFCSFLKNKKVGEVRVRDLRYIFLSTQKVFFDRLM